MTDADGHGHRAPRVPVGPEAGAGRDGHAEYKARVLNDRWTEQQVVRRCAAARRGTSGAGQQASSDAEAADMVRRAYQSVLNREPDAAGMRDYKARILNDRWTEQQLVNALRNSDEYRSKH